jgi:bacillithiol biosynthesis cysteine-adding enzyme BshC
VGGDKLERFQPIHRSGEQILNLEIHVDRPGSSTLVRAYFAAEPDVLRFFEGGPDDPEHFRAKAAAVAGRFDSTMRRAASEAIDAAPGPAAERLARVLAEDGFFVTTGQQPGLFTGPLYSVYKAITAIRLADRLEELLGKPVAPLYWVASEDHDWPEVDHVDLVDVENEVRRIQLPEGAGEGGRPIFRVPLHEALGGAVEAFVGALPDSDFAAPFVALLEEAYRNGATLNGGFREVLKDLLASHGLCFVDAADPALKALSRAVMTRELERASDHEAVLSETAAELEAQGLGVQVPILPGGINLFVEGPDGVRERLYRSEDGFILRHSGATYALDELREVIGNDPSRVSPNVLLRPVVENTVFPTVAYVAGPGEMAYYAQLRGFFRAHEIEMPVVYPRHGAVLVEPKIRKVLGKFSLELSSLDQPFHELAGEIARAEEPEDVKRILGQFRGAVGAAAGELTQAAKEIDPTLKGPIGQMRGAAFQLIADVEKKILLAIKRENEIALGQVEKAQHHLFPHGKPQERVMNVFYYLTRYGDALIPALMDRFTVDL